MKWWENAETSAPSGTRISVLVASCGRPTLQRALDSVRSQLLHGDELLLSIQTDEQWGQATRNRMMRAAKGDFVVHLDDDDILTPHALHIIRAGIMSSNRSWHVFRMRYSDGRVLWHDQKITYGNVGTPMLVAPPNGGLLGEGRHDGDTQYAYALHRALGAPEWHEDVVCEVRPNGA